MKHRDNSRASNSLPPARRVVLHTAPGTGVLVRRSGTLLFVPDATDAQTLVTGFEAAEAGREFEALAELALEAEMDLPPFAAVDFGPVVTVRIFGDLDLETDQPAASRLSAASCSTWIDHSIHQPGRNVAIRVAAESCNPLTDAQLGCFSAGGFELRLESQEDAGADGDPRLLKESQRPADHRHGACDAAAEFAILDDESSGSLVKLVLDGLLEPDVGQHDPPTGPAEEGREKAGEVSTLEPPVRIEVPVDVERETGRPRAVLRFDDGQRVEVRKPMVMGRNPIRMAETADVEPLVIAGGKVSRAHLKLSMEGDQLLIDDCGSRNGSAVLADGSAEPMQLLSGSPVAVDVGTKVFIGSRSFTVLETNPEVAR